MPATQDKFLVRMLYPIIDRLFSTRLANKIKICGCVLAGNWMIPYNFTGCSSSYLRSHSSNDIVEKNFPGLLDEDTREMICYFEKLRKLMPIWENPSLIAQMFIKAEFLFSDAEIAANQKEDREVARLRKKYGISYLYAETTSLVYHHGLIFLPEKVLEYIKGKDFIDAGAFDGASCIVFQKYLPRCVYAFEPSRLNQDLFCQTMKKNCLAKEKYQLIRKGLSDTAGMIEFDDTGGLANILSKKGAQVVEITSIDLFVRENNLQIGVIKADVEGMGLKVIQGCLETLCKNRPVLLLSVYHNEDELFGIYNFLCNLSLSYKIFCKLLHKALNELTLIAYPAELL